MFYYHAKACHEKECPDLSPLHIPGTTVDADLSAPVYSSNFSCQGIPPDPLKELCSVYLLHFGTEPLSKNILLSLCKGCLMFIKILVLLQSVLRSLGGAKLLIPLLENTSLPLAGEVNKVGVSLFLKLLLAFLDENNQNLFLLSNGIATVGALMEEVSDHERV